MDDRSRIPNFYRYSRTERVRLLLERQLIGDEEFHALMDGRQVLSADAADRLIENVVGVFGLPLGLGLNFVVNERAYVVPMAVEEPSIVAALSSAAKMVGEAGGFKATSDEPLLIGQVQVVDVPHPPQARAKVLQSAQELLDLANSLHPRMVARGGGAREVQALIHPLPALQRDMLVVHLLVDTRDAMGANLVNSMCEGIAPMIEKITGGRVFLRILSNLTDRALVRAEAVIPPALLRARGYSGEEVRDGVVLASDFAAVDLYRATTHNKGIMNGIDAVAIATGNDWRAIEAAAHAYAGRGSSYTSLSRWGADAQGHLIGRIEVPLKVGTVGGQVSSNPAVAVAHRILGTRSARELAELMACVGLAQNFAALRALSTEGIQRGHMSLHARSCAAAVEAPPALFDRVVQLLTESGEVKVWKAKEILARLLGEGDGAPTPDRVEAEAPLVGGSLAAAYGKVILLGEHAVVYGRHAIAAAIPLAIQARVTDGAEAGVRLRIDRWTVDDLLTRGATPQNDSQRCLALILERLEASDRDLQVEIFPHVPRAMGLGASASLAVAIIRGVAAHVGRSLTDEEVNQIAYASEEITHGRASGIDNTLATYGRFTLFRRGDPPLLSLVEAPRPIPIVIGLSNQESLTAKMVGAVRRAWERNPSLYEHVFDEIDGLTLQGLEAIRQFDLPRLGELMNVCQGLLNALGVSTWELEEMIGAARSAGALGAKLTGAGGGGSMVAICPADAPQVREHVAAELRKAGYRALVTEIS